MSVDPNLVTLAEYPAGQWVPFMGDDGELLNWVDGDLPMLRLQGLIESAVGPKGVEGPIFHRLTERGRALVAEAEV